MILRTAGGKAKNGMTSLSHARSPAWSDLTGTFAPISASKSARASPPRLSSVGLINPPGGLLRRSCDLFPSAEVQGMAHEVEQWQGLDCGLSECALMAFWKALEAVHNRRSGCLRRPGLPQKFVHHESQEFWPLHYWQPHSPRNLTFALRSDAQGYVNGFVLGPDGFPHRGF